MMQSQALLAEGDITTGEPARPEVVDYGMSLRDKRGIPAAPLLGVLPLKRVIPQNVHSVLDYSSGVVVAWAGLSSRRREAKIAGAVLGASVVGVSLLTDYRMSVAKLIPIEVHEVLDHLWGAAVIAAPFVFGYRKRAKGAALAHIVTGAAAILGSLFTDYRAERGVGRNVARALNP